MTNTWITNIQHFLNEDGDIAPIAGSAIKLIEYFSAIITLATSSGRDDYNECKCRRRPERKKCEGIIEAYIDPSNHEIVWQCPICFDNGRISHWEGTKWDKSNTRKQAGIT